MKNLITTFALVLLSILNAQAQTSKHFEIEIDPLAYSIGGASGHAAVAWKQHRVQLGYGQLTMPEGMQNHEEVSESFKAISLKYDLFFTGSAADHGLFAGPTVDYLFLNYEQNAANSFSENQVSLGVRAGYKFNLFKDQKTLNGLYLTPWIGTSWFTSNNEISVGTIKFERKAMTIFPTIHLGWSF